MDCSECLTDIHRIIEHGRVLRHHTTQWYCVVRQANIKYLRGIYALLGEGRLTTYLYGKLQEERISAALLLP